MASSTTAAKSTPFRGIRIGIATAHALVECEGREPVMAAQFVDEDGQCYFHGEFTRSGGVSLWSFGEAPCDPDGRTTINRVGDAFRLGPEISLGGKRGEEEVRKEVRLFADAFDVFELANLANGVFRMRKEIDEWWSSQEWRALSRQSRLHKSDWTYLVHILGEDLAAALDGKFLEGGRDVFEFFEADQEGPVISSMPWAIHLKAAPGQLLKAGPLGIVRMDKNSPGAAASVMRYLSVQHFHRRGGEAISAACGRAGKAYFNPEVAKFFGIEPDRPYEIMDEDPARRCIRVDRRPGDEVWVAREKAIVVVTDGNNGGLPKGRLEEK